MRVLSLLLVLGSATAAPVTFTKTYNNAVEVLQWTDNQGALSGTYQQVLRTDSRPPTLKTTNATFTGTRTGSTVTLRFSQSFLGFTDIRIWTGTLSGDTLKLTWPLAAGGLNTVVYTRSSANSYNAAVTRLSREVDAARSGFAQQQEQERAERAAVQAQTQAVEAADRAARRALEDAATLTGELQDGTRDLEAAVELLEKDLASLRKDQAELLRDAGQAKTCYDVSVVQGYQLGTLSGYSLSTLTGYGTSNLKNAAQQVQDDLDQAQPTLGRLQVAAQAHRTVPGANPRAQARLSFQPQQVAQAQAALGAQVEIAAATLASAQTRHQAILTEADALVDQARVVARGLTCLPGS
ncbi:hypothetical protein [Deinococcus budaensis]|uniref:Uncharacterized protein n=1 Tax=Deinococcus budaensis TaxID=1665626 RepID=A0A7W8LRI8_9DEIO|nr:hypothetical protein [Deinococcus budaensis]MBB5235938.1 hypothetical protein [Deinococcus budaensis]